MFRRHEPAGIAAKGLRCAETIFLVLATMPQLAAATDAAFAPATPAATGATTPAPTSAATPAATGAATPAATGAAAGASADETLLLDVQVNGHSIGKIGEFTLRRGKLMARPD
ncbi:MAG: hypothetical protein ABSG60_15725, partial [Terracidiphilus sp.]